MDAPVPFNEIILSETSTVVELTLVSVPLTNKLPLIVTLEPVSSIPVSIVVLNDSSVFNLVLCEPLVVSKEDNLLPTTE